MFLRTVESLCHSTFVARAELLIFRTVVFASGPGGGNPCPVVLSPDPLTQGSMQDLAQRFGEDTACVLRPTGLGADLRISYFVPDHQMGISGHATLAAVTVQLKEGLQRPGLTRIETRSGLFTADSSHSAGSYVITLEQNFPQFGPILDPAAISPALCHSPEEIDFRTGPIQAVSISRPKLLVPIRTPEILDRLKPNDEALNALCETTGVSGLYPFVRDRDQPRTTAQARQFPVRAGFSEDAATGVAVGAFCRDSYSPDIEQQSYTSYVLATKSSARNAAASHPIAGSADLKEQ